MARNDAALREHLSHALSWESAHLTLEDSLKGLPAGRGGPGAPGVGHTPGGGHAQNPRAHRGEHEVNVLEAYLGYDGVSG